MKVSELISILRQRDQDAELGDVKRVIQRAGKPVVRLPLTLPAAPDIDLNARLARALA